MRRSGSPGASGARTHIAHLHSTGGTFQMEAAPPEFVRPSPKGWRSPPGVSLHLLGYLSVVARFSSGWQERYGLTYGDLRVVGTGERVTASSFERYRLTQTLVSVPEGTMPFTRTLDLALAEDFCLIGSDGGIQREPRATCTRAGPAASRPQSDTHWIETSRWRGCGRR